MSNINLALLAQNLDIETVEELHVYTGMLLNRLHPNLKVVETPDGSVFAAEFNIFKISDGTHRVITRTSIEIDPAFNSDRTKKLWKFVRRLDNANVQIPPAFLAN